LYTVYGIHILCLCWWGVVHAALRSLGGHLATSRIHAYLKAPTYAFEADRQQSPNPSTAYCTSPPCYSSIGVTFNSSCFIPYSTGSGDLLSPAWLTKPRPLSWTSKAPTLHGRDSPWLTLNQRYGLLQARFASQIQCDCFSLINLYRFRG